MTMKNKFIISSEDLDKRLDKFLVEKFPEVSRSQIQKIIECGEILVNEKKVSKHYFLEEGNEVKILNVSENDVNNAAFVVEKVVPARTRQSLFDTDEASFSVEVIANPSVQFRIIFETPDYIIIEKPAGLVVHQAEGHPGPDTLVNGLIARWPEIINVGNVFPSSPSLPAGQAGLQQTSKPFSAETSNMRPGIVHRIDKDVSGVMIVARTNEMYEHLKKQFQERTIEKIYITLVHGKIHKEEDEIHFDIGRSKSDSRKMGAKPVGAQNNTREAITYFEVMKYFQRYTLLKVQIKTGRTHQIRVHLNAYGYPVVGDKLYRPKSLKTRINLGRMFLHAYKLGFYELNGKWVEYKSDLPRELEEFLRTLS